ncbi:2-isopropylmalate synthase [Phaeodactylum tricornutum CCAP 1055/1]|uniref:(R)-citramalate synthase n=1 Tax=Phaeodactylum tricornutum (strain CCAP 1055/1) TaxID=556484 RepID=B7G5N8_PHATC|nr:2-isopropylmalate synthase [Phaeodactylum tricornutum CCAP 1055/1]EEC46183.1 2-isopropylmalate synthase [Phaeodactylum tricornutum CCAP 1055/1]|eukprot:XP_002182282.1 2-isopropylmalate synthase [Phaeodactylum tricornutum CCAP 1055/1]
MPIHRHVRDGTQGESVSASVDDKLKITRRLVAFGVDFVEAGWPGSNPKDAAFFTRAKTDLTHAERDKLVAFGSTRRKRVRANEDPQVQALLESQAPTVCIVAKAHAWQVTEILRATLDENLDMIRDTVACLVAHGRVVMVDLEHALDGYATDPDYVHACCRAAVDGGASVLVACDTNGGTMPWRVGTVVRELVDTYGPQGVTIGMHAHNDCGMAVANSLTAAQYGAGLIQGTVNGIGERTGNADLCAIVPSLALHVQAQLHCRASLATLTSLSRFVDEVLNQTPNHAAPFVGSSAFAHKGGLHVAAMERSPLSYQHIEPELVGNEQRILISELSGRQNILGKMQQAGVDLGTSGSDRAVAILNRVKTLEAQGYTFEGAEASVHLMILHATKGYCPPFQVLDYSAQVYDANIDSATRVLRHTESPDTDPTDSKKPRKAPGFGPTARATVNVRTMRPIEDGLESYLANLSPYQDRLEVSDGNGPVDALANALMRALQPVHPILQHVELVDYKVRILDAENATGATTRVMIEFRNNSDGDQETWTTVSVDTNVISASLNALVDGFEYALIEHGESCMLCHLDDM